MTVRTYTVQGMGRGTIDKTCKRKLDREIASTCKEEK
jgi:hypothetical protein